MAQATITSLIASAEGGDAAAAEALFTALYSELHRLARRELAGRGHHVTLGVTTLLHEAYLDISGREGVVFPDRARFMAYASRVMRGLIIDHLSGRHPIAARGGSAADLIKTIVETDPLRLSDAAPGGKALRGDLDNIVATALKKSPAERYTSVTAFADDLRRYLRHEPVSARPDTLAYRTAKFVRRRRRAISAAAGVALGMAALVTFYTVQLASERDRARVEADKSAKIGELLTSLLTGADPFASRDREPTVRTILDAGAERVQKELADQPELKAEMLTVIGRVYQRLGAYDKAQPLLEEALSIGRRVTPGATAGLAQSLNDLGVLQRERGDPAGATPLLEEALAMRQALLGPEDKDVAVTLVELGRAYQDRRMSDRAEPLFRDALEIRRKVLGESHRETATSKSALALLLWQRGDIAAAEPLFRESLETSRQVLSEDHPNVGASWNNLGLVLMDKGDYAGAEPMFRRANAIRRKQFGERDPSIATTLNNLAGTLREQGQYDEAAAAIDEAIAVTREGPGDDHPSMAGYMVNRARIDLARHDAAAAEKRLRDALARQQTTLAADDWRLGSTRSLLAASLLDLGALPRGRTAAARRQRRVEGCAWTPGARRCRDARSAGRPVRSPEATRQGLALPARRSIGATQDLPPGPAEAGLYGAAGRVIWR
jgi:tetratricopeptide (TPR) repeat protein/DNA-directed RNA polymerase specialized sigma24 family protein